MKKNSISLCCFINSMSKISLGMKLLTFVLFVSVASVTANSYSQQTKFTMNLENRTVYQVFQEIEKTSEFILIYSEKSVDLDRKVNIKVEDETVKSILDQLFKGSNNHYEILDRQIVILSSEMSESQSLTKSITEGEQPQKKEITGSVKDSKGILIPGVSVYVKGTTTGTNTDNDGKFILSVSADAKTLVFSFVGMKSQEVAITGKTNITIVLMEEVTGVDEVVVVGYGTQKKINLTGAVASLKSRDLEKIPPTGSATNVLAGRLPGLISQQQSGLPGGDAATLSIRGFGNALIIVDGSETSFNNIDVNEIESVSVLKDASAAIYGARAGNGVILVTTKRGKDGKPKITFNSSYSLQTITNYPTMMSSGEWVEYDREKKMHMGQQQTYTQADQDLYYAGTNPDYPNTNWLKEAVKNAAPMQNHNLSVNGGNDRIKYFGFLGYMDQETFWKVDGGNFRRYNIRSNIDAKITDNLSVQFDFSNINDISRYSQRPPNGSAWHDIWMTRPMLLAHLPDPSKLPYSGIGSIYTSSRSINGFDDTDFQTIKTAGALKYNVPFIKGLSLKYFLNYSKFYSVNKVMQKPFTLWSYNYASDTYTSRIGTVSEAQLGQTNSWSHILTNQLSLNYDKVIAGNHTISALVVFESNDYGYADMQANRYHYITPAIEYLFAGSSTDQSNNGSANEMGRTSVIGRLDYSFKGKYLVETTLRSDASAKFPPEKRWGYFPSISAGWRISEEGFIKNNIGWLDNLKLRGSFSNTGFDNVGNFAYLSGYQFGIRDVLDGKTQNGLTSTGLDNPNLTWENMTLYNLGVDFSLFNSKLYGELDAFYRERSGIPATRLLSLPSTFGASMPPENLNSSNDRGFEAMIGTRSSKGDFSWDISGNISYSRAKWDHYEEADYSGDPDKVRIYQKSGKWADEIIGYKTDGLYTSQAEIDALTLNQDQLGNITIKPGDLKLVDINKDHKIDWRDQVVLGNGSIPHFMFGLSTIFRYKNFDLSVFFQGAGGNTVLIMNPNMDLFFGDHESISEEMFLGRWTEKNNDPHALFYRSASIAKGIIDQQAYSNHNYYLRSGTYLRLKTFNFGYTLPQRIINFGKAGNNTLRVYLAGTNLLTFSGLNKFQMDPEAPSGSWLYYPQQRVFTFGINLTF